MTLEQETYLRRRIHQLRSKMKRVGPFRQAGILRTIQGMKAQLKSGQWTPPMEAQQ